MAIPDLRQAEVVVHRSNVMEDEMRIIENVVKDLKRVTRILTARPVNLRSLEEMKDAIESAREWFVSTIEHEGLEDERAIREFLFDLDDLRDTATVTDVAAVYGLAKAIEAYREALEALDEAQVTHRQVIRHYKRLGAISGLAISTVEWRLVHFAYQTGCAITDAVRDDDQLRASSLERLGERFASDLGYFIKWRRNDHTLRIAGVAALRDLVENDPTFNLLVEARTFLREAGVVATRRFTGVDQRGGRRR